jgi:voltage-gated potassium channel Kch
LTTVGYGDVVPITETGRWAGVTIMVAGIALLGTLAGSLSNFFRFGDSTDATPDADNEKASADGALIVSKAGRGARFAVRISPTLSFGGRL